MASIKDIYNKVKPKIVKAITPPKPTPTARIQGPQAGPMSMVPAPVQGPVKNQSVYVPTVPVVNQSRVPGAVTTPVRTTPTPIVTPTSTPRPTNTGGGGTVVTPTAPVVPGATTTPPPDSAAGIQSAFQYEQSQEEKDSADAMRRYLAGLNEDVNQDVNQETIYNNYLAQFQGQIDATNKVYNDMLNKARIEGAGRIESRQFSQGRSGQIGSGTGEAGVNAVQDANREVEQSIDNQRNAEIASILAKVRNSAAEELAAKTKAKREGAEALLKFYDEAPARKAKRVNPVTAQLISLGIDPENMSEEEIQSIVEGTGASREEIISNYKTTKAKQEAEATKAQLENDKLTAEVNNLVNKQDWESAEKALDRALEEKKIDVQWYNAQTARLKAEKELSEDDPLEGKNPAYEGEVLNMGDDTDRMAELEAVGVTTDAIIKIQTELAKGYSLKQIAQSVDMPQDVYNKLNEFIEIAE